MSNLNRREFVRLAAGMGSYGIVGLNTTFVGANQGKVDKSQTKGLVQEIRMIEVKCLSSSNNSFADEPAMAMGEDGKVWVAWLARKRNGKEAVMINYRKRHWSGAREIGPEGYYDQPQIACGKNGGAMVVWVSNVGDSWGIESSICKGKDFEEPRAATTVKDGRASHPYLISNNDGGYWLAWESYKKGRFNICLKEYRGGKWGETVRISNGKENVYSPAITIDRAGVIWIAYSKAEKGELNIYLNNYKPTESGVGKEIAVCLGGERTYQCGHPDVCCDADDRIWVAWERRGDNKKRDCYFGMSECWVGCWDGNELKTIRAKEAGYGGKRVFASANNQQPKFFKDDNGRLWLGSREFIEPGAKGKKGKRRHNRRAWKIVGSRLDEERGWTPKVDLVGDVRWGRLGRTSVACGEGGLLWVAWQGDNILEPGEVIAPRYSDIYVAKTKIAGPEIENKEISFEVYDAGKIGDASKGRPWVKRRTVEHDGQKYTWLYGNLHEHTNISRCWIDGSDGELDENYRYGIDVEGYDFVGMTDHGYDMHEVNWRKTRRAAQFYTEEPYFVGLPAYEWTLSAGPKVIPGSGHRNVIFASDEDAAKFINPKTNNIYESRATPESNMPDKLWGLLRAKNIKAVTIPHHTADKQHPMDWNYHDEEYQCVAEIFQCRESCEHKGCPRETTNLTSAKGCYIQDGLAKGYKMGLIASGDHNSMGIGLAAVLVKEVSQKGIVEALRARRCFATTGDKIFIDFSINGCLMGEEINANKKPHITAKITGTDELTNIVIFRDGEIIYERDGEQLKNKKEWKIDFVDNMPGEHSYYYLRVIQDNQEIGWSSPIWVKS